MRGGGVKAKVDDQSGEAANDFAGKAESVAASIASIGPKAQLAGLAFAKFERYGNSSNNSASCLGMLIS